MLKGDGRDAEAEFANQARKREKQTLQDAARLRPYGWLGGEAGGLWLDT
jgi:hypothetical protein